MTEHIPALKARKVYSATTHLTTYGLAVAIPLVLLLGFFLARSLSAERTLIERQLVQLASDLADDLDRDFDRRIAMLDTLATSPALKDGDWPAFYEQAKAAAEGRGFIILIDSSLRQIVNTFVPYGTAPARTGDPATALRVIESKKPDVSDLFVSLVTHTHVFNVDVPVLENGAVRYILILGLRPSDLLPMLQKTDPEWVTTVWDRKGSVVARSRAHDRFLGTTLRPELSAVESGRALKVVNLDDERVLRATAVTATGHWGVAVNAPLALVNASLVASMWLLGGAVLIATILAGGLGLMFGRGLARPLSLVSEAALALGRGERIETVGSRLREANSLAQALQQAQRDLDNRETVLRERDNQLRIASEAAQFGTYTFDIARQRARWSNDLKRIVGRDREEPTIGTALSFVHPADADRTRQSLEEVMAGRLDRYHLEYRIRRADGATRWVMDRGQTVRDSTGRVASVVGVLIDITVIKEAEERQQLLINELNHRVKNTLAIVKSMASQTLRATPDPQAFAALFAGRLEALSGAHALLTDRKWDAVALADLVRSSVSPFIDPANRISIKGPHIDLPPNTTITLGLMLHELATNASKHGALSTPQGIVSIAWSADPGPEGQTITLRWTEQGGPHVQPSNRIGFGSRLLDASAAQLDGEMTADFERTGLRWSIVFSVKATPNVGMDYAG